jgi:phage terminase small subunit
VPLQFFIFYSQAEDIDAAIPLPPKLDNKNSKPRGPSLVREAEETAAEVEATLASYATSTGGGTAAPLVRPSSATSSLATEYYGRPLHSASAGARTAEAAAAPAADRLYSDHFRKQAMLNEQRRIRDLELQLATQQVYCTPVSRALAAHRTAGSYSSYGERLYAEGRLEALKREAEIAQMRAQEAEKEIAGVTFHPQISKFAQNMKLSSAAHSRSSSAGSNGFSSAGPWDRLHNQGSALKKERRAEAIRKEIEEEELKECRFKPRVDRNSARLVHERRGIATDNRLPLYQRLYNEGLFTKERQQENALMWLPDDATFKPKVNTSSVVMNDLLAVAEEDISGALAQDVSERLLLRGKRCQEKLEAARQASIAPIDAEGRLLFQPKTLRAPRGVDRTGPIGEHLYTAALQSSAKAEAQAEAARKQALHQAASVHVNSVSIKLMEKLQRERLTAVFAYLARVGPSQMIPTEINLLEVLNDEEFMDTIDPEVRADVEHAGKLLRRTIKAHQQQNGAGSAAALNESETGDSARVDTTSININENDDTVGKWSLKVSSSSSARGGSAGGASVATTNAASVAHPERKALWAMSHNGEVTEIGFIALMSEVLDRTRGIARQYLLPLPSTRKKWEEPTFKPAIEPRSLALAARTRPEGLPAHEVLYRTAQETAEKKEIARKEQEAAILKECSFQPTFVAVHPVVNQGRALKMASQPPVIKHTLTKQEVEARREEEELCEIAVEAEQRKHHMQQQRRGIAARGSSAAEYSTTKQGGYVAVGHDAAAGIPPIPPSANSDDPIDAVHPTTTDTAEAGENISNGNSLEDGIDAIERQIQDAMARLNMTGESFVAPLGTVPAQNKTANAYNSSGGAVFPKRIVDIAASCSAVTIGKSSPKQADVQEQLHEQQPTASNNAAAAAARLRASLDYTALFGGGSLAEISATSVSASVSGTAGGKLEEEEFSDFNPMKDGLTPANIEALGCNDIEPAALPQAQQQQQEVRSLLAQLAREPFPADLVECTGSSC